jgi:hypothetical protein
MLTYWITLNAVKIMLESGKFAFTFSDRNALPSAACNGPARRRKGRSSIMPKLPIMLSFGYRAKRLD